MVPRTLSKKNQEKKAIIPVGCKRLTRSRFFLTPFHLMTSCAINDAGLEGVAYVLILVTLKLNVVLASISICLRYLVFLYKGKLIGEGGYAEVYKGQLEDGQFVASKRLTRGSPEEMTVDFLSVPGIIVHVDHPNIAKVFLIKEEIS
ncbi:hypothetical protein NC652_022055 [Populus alba x Populus x berolinensis]|nr:hypothetical protein NC652_022055 [Populus alba x Populus x berolinensis]